MKNLKNIYLVGPSRCGKTSTATFLQNEYGYTHIIMDAVIETMRDFAPQLGITHGKLDNEEFIKFLGTYSKNLFKYTKHNIIDIEVLEPTAAKSIIDSDESTVIYMGYPSITPQEKLEQIRKNDTEFDWTRSLSDKELLEFLSTNIEKSKILKEDATKHGFEFIDTSFDREDVISQRIKHMIDEGVLDRTSESYERYYR